MGRVASRFCRIGIKRLDGMGPRFTPGKVIELCVVSHQEERSTWNKRSAKFRRLL